MTTKILTVCNNQIKLTETIAKPAGCESYPMLEIEMPSCDLHTYQIQNAMLRRNVFPEWADSFEIQGRFEIDGVWFVRLVQNGTGDHTEII